MQPTLSVLLPLPLPPFDFLAPHGGLLPAVGCRVVVPWQQGIRIGIVMAHKTPSGGAALELREVIGALETQPFVTELGLELLTRLAEETCAPLGLLLATLLPTGLSDALEHEIRPLAGADVPDLTANWQPAASLPGTTLDLYRRQGLLEERVRVVEATQRVLRAIKGADDAISGARQANQRQALEVLWSFDWVDSAAALAREAEVPESAARNLVAKGYAEYATVPALPPALPQYASQEPPFISIDLSLPADAPQLSLSGGLRHERLAALLPLLRHDLTRGGSVLVLVPEQVLLEETAAALATELPVLVMSGDLSDTQRLRVWQELQTGEPVVLVTSYLGLLAPLPELSRIVVLEEGSASYKLMSGSRLFVPTAARLLAELSSAPLLLSDALTTLETFHEVAGEHRFRLPTTAVRSHVSDLSSDSNWPLSLDLIRVLKQVQERQRQAVILAPRRGFSAALGCQDCGWTAQCPNCDLPLRYHRERYRLRCHQCGYETELPSRCPDCHGLELQPTRTAGTQWIATEIRKLLPNLSVIRYDSDQRDDVTSLMDGESGVLVGTTAVLRLPPLPNVSLIAVSLMDAVLNLGDFRAEEEALRFLLNLAELAPGHRPLTVIQSFQPEHAVLSAYRDGGEALQGFLAEMLARRQRFHYPPCSQLAKVQISSRQASEAERAAKWLAGAIHTAGASEDELLGPTPAPVARIKNLYSQQLFVRAADKVRLRTLLGSAISYRGSARLRIDVDPREIGGFID